MKKEVRLSFILNALIVILEIAGIIISYKVMNRLSIEYYTIDSNILALCSSLIYCIYIFLNKKIPKWLSMFKYITTIGLSVTFIVVLFILLPMAGYNLYAMFVSDSLIFHHLLCPLIGIITFIYFDKLNDYTFKDSFYGLIFTAIYSIVLIILNIKNIVDGPYPFLRVKYQSVSTSIVWFIVIYLIAYFISFTLRKYRLRFNRSK